MEIVQGGLELTVVTQVALQHVFNLSVFSLLRSIGTRLQSVRHLLACSKSLAI